MDDTLEREFQTRWPQWFGGLDEGPQKSCLAFGFCCGPGWKDLLWRLCEDIEKLGPGEDFEVHQVKEKFGGLRFYTSGTTREVLDRISEAEQESYETCENCGTKENVTTGGRGWVSTLCDKCRKPKPEDEEE